MNAGEGTAGTAPARPWSGRRLHFVGVGGAGMSAYARAAHALGAQVGGSDAAASPYSQRLAADGILDAAIGHRAENVPAGAGVEVVYSSAVPADNVERSAARERGIAELSRAHLLGELSALRRTIAVAGTHGKTTTASMLVHALRCAGMDPGWLVGAPVGEGLANAHWSAGEWLVVEADESDRSMLSLSVEVAVVTNVELDHHATFASLAQVREAFAEFLSGPRAAVVWDRPELLELRDGPVVAYDVSEVALSAQGSRFMWNGHQVSLAVPGEHNALNAVGALEAARLAGADSASAIAGLAGFHGAGRRFQALGRSAAGALLYDDYAHHPTEIAATLTAARTLAPRRLVAVFQPHLYSRTALLARELGATLALADTAVVLDVYPAREHAEDHPGVSGLMVAEAAADSAGGGPVYWLSSFAAAESVLREMLGEGDLCVLMGAGNIDELGRALVGVPAGVQRDYPLARLTTVRTGGAGEFFARAGSEARLVELLAWAAGAGVTVAVVGSGSNLLVADEGVAGLVVKLDRELADIAVEGSRMVCGGGARLPAVAARAAREGLSGIEFGVNIPGTVGGAVRMNANAYDGQLERVLEWVDVATATGVQRRQPAQLGLSYRRSNLRDGEIVMRASLALAPAAPQAVKAMLADMRRRRHEAQPQGIRTFGSTFKNPDDPRALGRSAGLLLAEAGCNGVGVGGARFAPKHANFIENTGEATTADVLAVMAEGRRRVLERFGVELEPEVQTLGDVRFGWRTDAARL
ncbi:MAG TPA: UDP-N-acetylmuramate--L-alanine ligase [Solirubrobacteraceae bacterium]|nr:UDP-N-acetylmuramate--L-alanine ligase [Solirubrobacteraceae bacterium]